MQDVLVRARNGERGPLALGRDAVLGQEGRGASTSGSGDHRSPLRSTVIMATPHGAPVCPCALHLKAVA